MHKPDTKFAQPGRSATGAEHTFMGNVSVGVTIQYAHMHGYAQPGMQAGFPEVVQFS